MKKTSRILAVVLALCLVCSLFSGYTMRAADDKETPPVGAAAPAANAEAFAQVDDTHWAGGALTIEKVEYDEAYASYVDSTLFTSVTKIVYDGGEIDIDSTLYTPILTVDGVQQDLYNAEGESFAGDCEITLVTKGGSSNNGNSKFGADGGSSIGAFYYAPAIYVEEGAYDASKSAVSAQQGGQVSDAEATGVTVVSEGDYFSAIYVNNSDYTIDGANISLVGAGGDDFNGWGAGVVVLGTSNVSLNNSYIYAKGALRSGLFTAGSSVTTVNDSIIFTEIDQDALDTVYTTDDNYATPMMQQCPFALGLTGNVRATLACGAGENIFNNSLIVSTGWAVLSTDSGRSGADALECNDSIAVLGTVEEAQEGVEYTGTYDLNGVTYGYTAAKVGELSGYIAYADAGVLGYATNSQWYAPDYLGIITSGTMSFTNCYGWSDRIGFMCHQSSGNGMTALKTEFDVSDVFAMTKSCNATFTLELSTVNFTGENPWGGVLFESIESDDLGGGPGATSYDIPYVSYEDYLAGALSATETVSVLNLIDSYIEGDVYNSIQSSYKGVNVVLESSDLTGTVSSSWGVHCDEDGNVLVGDMTVDSYAAEGTYDYLTIGRILNFAAPTVNNPVTIDLKNSSTWTCTGLSYLSKLTFDGTSSIVGDVYVGGEQVFPVGAGEFTDVIVVPAGMTLADAIAEAEAAVATAVANGIPCQTVDTGENVDLGMSGDKDMGMPSGDKGEGMPSDDAAPAAAAPAGDSAWDAYKAYVIDAFNNDEGAPEDIRESTLLTLEESTEESYANGTGEPYAMLLEVGIIVSFDQYQP